MQLKTAKELNQITRQVKYDSYQGHILLLAESTNAASLEGKFEVHHYIGKLSISNKILLIEKLKVDYEFDVAILYNKTIQDSDMLTVSWGETSQYE